MSSRFCSLIFNENLYSIFFANSPVVTSILNEKKLAAVHLATELNKVSALQVMGKYKDIIDIQQGL
jgi:transient receptor potential cation channel subfamily A protein 1